MWNIGEHVFTKFLHFANSRGGGMGRRQPVGLSWRKNVSRDEEIEVEEVVREDAMDVRMMLDQRP